MLFLVLSSLTGALRAQVTDYDTMRDVLAPTGTLRAAFLATNPVQARVDPETNEIRGPVADIASELGRLMGVPVSMQPLPGVPAVIDAVSGGSADIGFLAYDATRAERVAFTQAYIYGHNSYIVRTDSPIRTFADADREGIRIGARTGNAVDLFLSRTLERAELVHLPRRTTEAEATRMLLANEIDAYATNKQRLAAAVANEPRIRVLDGSVLPVEQSVVVAQGNDVAVPQLDRFIDEARTSGFLQSLVDRYMLAGVEVAPKVSR